jgi:FKBP-type peptidyl-prolyl cis-trans isomerase 2
MQQVKNGDKVKVHYHGKLTNGETFDSSEGRDPLEFEVGAGMVIKGFDDGVTGMVVGDKKTVNIPVTEAYGPRNDEMLVEFPKDRLPADMQIEEGMPLMMSNETGQQFQVVVVEVKDDAVVLDANHPLAGGNSRQKAVDNNALIFVFGTDRITGNRHGLWFPAVTNHFYVKQCQPLLNNYASYLFIYCCGKIFKVCAGGYTE